MRRQDGVTLVEVMVALVVLLIVFMGLLQASLLSIDHNLRNEVRDEATRIASETMARARSTAFSGITPGVTVVDPLMRNFRNFSQAYRVTTTITAHDIDTREIHVNVAYAYRGEPLVGYDFRSLLRNR